MAKIKDHISYSKSIESENLYEPEIQNYRQSKINHVTQF